MRSQSPTEASYGGIGIRPPQGRIQLVVVLGGSRALAFLESPAPGVVLHVFENSVYLENACGDLACLGGPIIGAAPLNGVVALDEGFPGWRTLLSEGDAVAARGNRIFLGQSLALRCGGTRPWRPAAPARPIRPGLLAAHLEALGATCAARAPRGGLGFLVGRRAFSPSPDFDGVCGPPDKLSQALAARANPAMVALEEWLYRMLAVGIPSPGRIASGPLTAGQTVAPPPREAARLIGLGPGLTPSGDDLIGGMCLALHAIGRAGPAEALGRWAVSLGRTRTSAISLAHLSAASGGEGASALHEVLNGLGRHTGWNAESVLNDPFFHGHSSGWDALAGIWAVMSAVSAAMGTGSLLPAGDRGML